MQEASSQLKANTIRDWIVLFATSIALAVTISGGVMWLADQRYATITDLSRNDIAMKRSLLESVMELRKENLRFRIDELVIRRKLDGVTKLDKALLGMYREKLQSLEQEY